VQYDITGGTRPGGGANLFHSFGDFGVPTNHIANFLNETGLPTSNILGRVTGGDMSNIFGTIQTTGFENANLFLMNPAGFLFGPNAIVNVGGMVAFTSADYLKLTDSARFNAIPNVAADVLLTALPVASFGFLGSNPGAITVQGSQFSAKNISLVGGNITIESGTPDGGTAKAARLSAPNGNILLASAGSPGEFHATGLQPLPNVNGTSFSSLGSVSLAPGASIDVSGTSTVSIRGGEFVLSVKDTVLTTAESPSTPNTFSLSRGSSIVSSNSGTNLGADIKIVAGTLQMDDAKILNNTLGLGGGAGGNISIDASQFALSNQATLSTQTAGSGKAGNITVMASSFSMSERALISAGTDKGTTGHGGNISVQADEVLMTDNAGIITSALGSGKAGAIAITVQNRISLTDSRMSSSTFASPGKPEGGQGGQITLHAPTIDISNGQIVSLSSSSGNAGNILLETAHLTLDASQLLASAFKSGSGGDITIRGLTDAGSSASQVSLMGASQVLSETANTGNGETIAIRTAQLMMQDNSLISTSSQGAGTVGNAGDITLNAGQSLRMMSGSLIQSGSIALSEGNAGNITVTAPAITLDAGTISTTTEFAGNAGTVMIKTNSLTVQNGGQIASSSVIVDDIPAGSAGNITIQGLASPSQSVLIDGVDSGIFTDTQGTGAGGNINLTAGQSVTISNGASVSASSTGPGNAGNISVNAGQQFEMRDSSITTQATKATGGNINIQAIDRVRLVNSPISTSVRSGPGSGGNITIDPNVVVLQNSPITAQADRGAGGNITITTPLFLADSTSPVSASSQFGRNGTVTIQSPTSNLSESLGTLPSEPNQAHSLLTQRCAALVNGQSSSFVVAGREQLPADPGGWLTSPLAFTALGESLDAGHAAAAAPATMPIAGHDTGTVSLRRLTPAGFLMANFAESAATGCHS
jgi:filamentous hemagglutinin family protein